MTGYAHRLVSCGFGLMLATLAGSHVSAASPEASPEFGPPAPESVKGADLGQPSFDASLIAERIAASRDAVLPQGAADDGLAPVCAGNLVVNGDFETVGSCPTTIGQLSFAPPWYLPTPGSADFFHACAGSGIAQPGIPTNFYGTVTPFSGSGVGGYRVYGNVPPNTTTDYREYLQIPLNASLIGGQTYTVSFRAILSAASSAYGIKELDAYFSAGPIYSGASTQLNVVPQFTNPGPPVTSTSSWTLVTGTFVAAGGENHMTLGNFKNDASTTAVVAGGGCCPVAYYYLDDVCVTGLAGTLLGACCYQGAAGMVCQLLTDPQCASLNGYFYGKGTDCAGVSCTIPFGGCCIPGPTPGTNLCQIETPADCAAIGGTYLGNGVFCQPGNPCNPPTGACCYSLPGNPVNQCVITTAAACATTYVGTYLGDNSVCTPDPCNVTGACCYSKPGTPGNLCQVTTQFICLNTLAGAYLGDGTTCPPGNCNPLPVKGACCYQMAGSTSFACTQTSATGCLSYFNSTFLGLGTSCPPLACNDSPLGACCYVHSSGMTVCVLATQDDCEDDLLGTYLGNFTTCQPFPCTPAPLVGACCYQDLPNPTFMCAITTALNCAQNFPNSTYMGNGTTCSPNPCPPELNGACCYMVPGTTISTCILTNASDCVTVYHGTYQGNGTLCTPNPCAPTGACCYQTPVGPGCVMTTAADCASIYFGVYQGDNVPCTPNPCLPTGACCYTDPQGLPACIITTQQLCVSQYMGNWLGANTTCNPNPCIPVGACCWQDTVTSPIKCVIVSQAVCVTYPNSVWQGANTTCNPNPCPSGACCYQVQGSPNFTCIVTTAQICATLLNSTFYGVGTNCNNIECRPCVRPPLKMVAWWTLDELVGGIANDSIAGHHGAYKPTVATGPIPGPGVVGGALGFDGANDFVQVPHSGQLNFGCAAFTIDAWIRPLSLSGGIVRKIAVNGYDFHILPGGQLGLRLNSTSGTCNLASTGTIVANQWTHVAVTASAGGPTRTVTFYINGVASGTTVTPCVCLGNAAPVIIGQSAITGFLRGRLDEIEMFRRVLPASEIFAIFNAGTVGKCKTRIHAPFNTPLCLNQNSVTVPITICNDSPTPFSYNVSFQPLNSCTIPGPTVFTPLLLLNPVNVPANGCVTVNVTINRPIGMVAVNQVACYQINALNLTTGQTFYGQGSLKDRRDLCAVIGPCCIGTGVIDVPIGTPISVGVKVTNTSGQAINTPLMIKGFDSQNGEPSDELRLNGLPPGTRYIGNLSLAPGAEQDITFTVGYEQHNALAVDDIVISTDLDGDGTFESLMSIGAASMPHLCGADLVSDGLVNVEDLLAVIAAWGPCQPAPATCPADIAPAGPPLGDGVVNVQDLLRVIGAWGECP